MEQINKLNMIKEANKVKTKPSRPSRPSRRSPFICDVCFEEAEAKVRHEEQGLQVCTECSETE